MRAQHLPRVVLELAAGLCDGHGRGTKGYKTAVTITWKYAAGEQSMGGFKEAFEKGGGKVVKELFAAVPERRVPGAADRDRGDQARRCVYAFFAGGGAVKFVKDYAAAGLKKKIPLLGAGFLTDGTLDAQGAAAEDC